jgi:sarcosine oxidase subunit alpha
MIELRTTEGGAIDRRRPVSFHFDGQRYRGYHGDTLASALLANDVHLMGRSFKYHRPRGVLGAGAEEPNALVGVWRDSRTYTPNLRATQVEIYEGLKAESQNRWPSLTRDFGRINDLIAPFIPAGFYYKTFMWPRRAWHALYEPAIRSSAGLGRAPTGPDPELYAQRFEHCDVLVVGAGPAGLSAALAAARSGARVILCDEQSAPGGSLRAEREAQINNESAAQWVAKAWAALSACANVMLLPRTQAFGYFPHNLIGLNQRLSDHLARPDPQQPRERLWQVRAREVVLATGALERPLVFPGNDRPGIMLADAARTYLNVYGVRVGSRVVIVTACDSAYRAALELHAAGVQIAVIADIRPQVNGALPGQARQAGLPLLSGCTVQGTRGRLRVSAVDLAHVESGGAVRPAGRFACDALLMSGGFTPSVHLFSQSRGKLVWSEALQVFVPGNSAEAECSAGACRGIYALDAVLIDGDAAGCAAAQRAGHVATTSQFKVEASAAHDGSFAGALAQVAGWAGKRAFIDWQNDVTVADLKLATREGFRSVEHIKRYTTTGMATDQGKTSNINALGVVAVELGCTVPQIGLTTFRMPYTPLSFGSLAGYARGDLFDPVRKTAIHDWAVARGAVFEDVGLWKRARFFPRDSESMDEAVARECLAVRATCGIFDASTLGKIEVVGPDAAEFLNRLYVNSWSNLAPGRSRYGILLREDGFVYDDGVIARLDAERFHVTTTTGGAPRVLAFMEDYLQTEWSDLKVWLTSTTEQWSVIAVQGPRAREVLKGLIQDIDLSAEALPHMGVARGRIGNAPVLLFRVSFSGELGFEVNVPADYGRAAWEAIWAAGEAFGLVPYGTETMHVLRAEKGYIIVGQDTDGTVTPDDAGLSWAIGKNKPDFVGRRSIQRPAMQAPDRKQLIGLLTVDPRIVLEEGAQVVESPGQTPPMRLLGHVTSSYHSAVLGHSIALAMVAGGRARIGQTLHVPMPGTDIPVRVVAPVFYDPKGARLHG